MTKTIAININNVFRNREMIFISLVSVIAVCVVAYIYFLHGAIANVVERESIVKQTRALSTNVSELEAKYFTVKNRINIELAHEKGFAAAPSTSFISRKSVTAMAIHNEL